MSTKTQQSAHSFARVYLAQPLLRWLYRAEAEYEAAMPDGPVILASNHRSFLDPVMVGAFWRFHVSYFAKASLWKIPGVQQMLTIFGGFPIDRREPQLQIMKRVVAALRAGTTICLFPEGTRTRSGRMGRLRPGAGLFARRAQVPIVPVYLVRTDAIWPIGHMLPRLGGRVRVVYGAPLVPPDGCRGRAAEQWLTDRLTEWYDRQEQRFLGPPTDKALAG